MQKTASIRTRHRPTASETEKHFNKSLLALAALLDNIELNIERGYEGKPYVELDGTKETPAGKCLKRAMLANFSAGIFCFSIKIDKK
ncbi:MAG: hypothetical protein FWG66_07310 [Spirochaetes bacterium]|nr:hypothetical protein [Spirochaetota bacterium]